MITQLLLVATPILFCVLGEIIYYNLLHKHTIVYLWLAAHKWIWALVGSLAGVLAILLGKAKIEEYLANRKVKTTLETHDQIQQKVDQIDQTIAQLEQKKKDLDTQHQKDQQQYQNNQLQPPNNDQIVELLNKLQNK